MQTKFKVGDKVKVVRKVESFANGWENTWEVEMDEAIGKVGEISDGDSDAPNTAGFCIQIDDSASWYFPPEALELVEEGLTVSCGEEKSLREAIAIARGIDTLGRISQNAIDTLADFVEAYLDNPTK